MSHAKEVSKRRRRTKAVPVLGVAGMSLSLAGGASAATTGPATDTPSNTGPSHEIFLGEEEMADVSLATFYVFDKENLDNQLNGVQFARSGGCGRCGRCGGCARCGRCGRGCGCGGCGGCGCGCCLSWGACRWWC